MSALTDLDPMPFGPYKGTAMCCVSPEFLAFLKDCNVDCPDVRAYIDENWDHIVSQIPNREETVRINKLLDDREKRRNSNVRRHPFPKPGDIVVMQDNGGPFSDIVSKERFEVVESDIEKNIIRIKGKILGRDPFWWEADDVEIIEFSEGGAA